MKRKRHSPEQIIRKLREADRWLSEGKTIAELCQRLAISEQTFRRSQSRVARRLLILTLRPRVNRQALQGWGRDFDLFPAVAYMDTNARFSTFCGNLI